MLLKRAKLDGTKTQMILVFQTPPEVFLGMFVGVQIPPIAKVVWKPSDSELKCTLHKKNKQTARL